MAESAPLSHLAFLHQVLAACKRTDNNLRTFLDAARNDNTADYVRGVEDTIRVTNALFSSLYCAIADSAIEKSQRL